jgi:chemotaxis protein CheC
MSYTAPQLDALRHAATIGSSGAAAALGTMLGRTVELSVPTVVGVPVADAAAAIGDPGDEATAVVVPLFGALDAVVVLLFTPAAADTLCTLLGVAPGSAVGVSALQEIGNILGTSYVRALETMTRLHLEPRPPQAKADLLGAILGTVLAHATGRAETALLMDSSLLVEGEDCSVTFLLLPTPAGVALLLDGLGVA